MQKTVVRPFSERGEQGRIYREQSTSEIANITKWESKGQREVVVLHSRSYPGHYINRIISVQGIAFEPIGLGDKVILELDNHSATQCLVTEIHCSGTPNGVIRFNACLQVQ